MRVAYYPGCALHGSSNDYEKSVRACMEVLGVELEDIPDWICCGASAAHSINHKLSVALPARNLALAEREGHDQILAPCPMCSMELIKANDAISKDEKTKKEMASIIELDVEGNTQVLNLIQVFQRFGLDALKDKVTKPLEGMKIACYYGCLLTRPPEKLQFDDCEQPSSMETILKALGAETVEWNYKTECCGAGMTMANEETVLDLSHKILTDVRAHEADCLCVACPMCHVNLDMKQEAIEKHWGVEHGLVVYYLSDLVGLALGLDPHQLGIDQHFVVKQ
jgi:heterodisulfide reductase subunit B2